ncbi:MAG: fibronectin type III domain-containing protein, partial [Bacteroidales bacterium]|nr:fibronectin type III domain-containing protein [Bacteroidales bacterium]
MKRLLFFLMAIIFAISAQSQGEITIGNGTGTGLFPINHYYKYNYSQMLYDQSSLMPGTISAIKFKYSASVGYTANPIVVYMKNTSKTSFESSTDYDSVGLVQVFSGSVTSSTGWVTIALNTPFVYDGLGSLLIAVDNNTGSYPGTYSSYWNNTPTTNNKTLNASSDTYNTDPLNPNGNSALKAVSQSLPNLTIVITPSDPGFCFAPTNVNSSNIISEGAKISWNFNVNVSSYSIEYKTSSQTWAESTIITGINDTLYNLSGLIANTIYDIRVSPECSTSLSTSLSFRTACSEISLLPYNEFFDSYGTGSTIFPPCWSKITSNTYPYIATTYSSSPGSLYMYTASGAYNYLVTPEFDASIPINSLSAFFKLYKTSAAYNITVGVMTDPTDVSTFDSIINLTPISTSIWETFGVDFANYTGSGQYIAFKVQGYGATNSMYIDDLEIIETPSCAIPTNLTQLTTTSNSIELDWDSNDDANCLGWIIDYKTSDDLVWQTENVTSHPYVISNLSSGVMYNVRLRAICTSQDTTKYTNIINCGMPCEPISVFPWEEGFENSWWVGDGIGGTTDSRPWCWVNLNGGTQTSGFWRKTTSSSYIHSGSGAAQMYSGSTTAGLSGDWLITPVFSLTENQILRFWAKGYSTYTDILSVKVIDATTNGIVNEYSDTSLFVDIMPNTIIPSSDWVEYEVNLSRFSGNYQIAFVRNTTGGNYLNIDDISIIDLPACARPTNVEITSINLSEAVFEWMPGHTGDASWCLYYKTNFDIFYDSVLVNTYTYTLQNLIPHATYTYYLRTKCGTELSEPTNISTFTTTAPIVNCGTITQFPWIENFDGLASDAFPQCWSRPVIYNTYPKTSTSSSRVQSAPTSLEIHSAVGSPTYAITPQLGVDINQLMVTFWAKAESATSSGTIEVGVMSDPTDLTTFESVQIIQPTNTSYNKYEVSFAGTTLNGANNYIAFRQNTISSYYYYWIDDIKVSELPTCFMPTALLASNETTTGFDLGWTDANSSLYNIQYMLSSQTDWVNATTISGVTSPYSLNGLSAGTSYKVRLQTDCGTEQSEWSLPITNSTACGAITQFPWTEGFENTFVSAILPGNKTSPLCWYIVDSLNTSSYYWQTSSTAYSGSKAVYMYGYASSTTTTTTYNNNDWLISPIITLTGSERLNFWSKKSSSSYYPDLLIYAMDVSQGDLNPTIPNTNFVLIGKVDTAVLSTTYSEFEFNLSTLVGDYRLAFVRKKIANGSVYIDDVKVDAIPSCASPLDISATSTTNSIEVSVTPSEVTDNGWKLLFREVNSANWNSLNITSNIVTIPNLQPQMEYEIYAKTLCSDASYSLPTNSIFVATKQIPVQTPYVCNFEAQGNNGWFIKNGASVNRWMIGTPVGAPSNALFVSNNNANLAYSVGLQNVVIAEKLFNITSPDSLELSFDLMVGGESTWDFLKVFFVDMDTVFAPSIEETYFSYDIYSEGIIMQNETNNFINLIPITHLTTRFVSPGIGVQKKLIFVWRNDGSAGNAISAYIDNISLLNIITPYPPTNLQATPSITTSQLSWTPGAAEIGWQVRKGETGALVNVTNANYQANALSPSTEYTYYIRSYYGDTLYSVWVPVTFRSLAIPQRVSTLAATDIDQTTATLHGTIIAGSDPITDQGFEYRVSGSSTWTPISVMQDDTIVYNLSGLSAYTEYEYRSFASTDYITIYGRTQDFTTLPAPPTALTSSATLIEQTIATLNGVISQGSMPIIEKGFEWRLAGSSTWTTEISTLSENTIACSLAGLIASTDYEYRVFVSTASVTVYGTVENFTTLAIVPPTVTTTLPSAITQTIATLNANILLGSEIITGQGFEWRLLGASTWTTMPSVLMVGTITSNITGLVASTDYEYRAYSTTASGTVYGNQQVFTTLDIVPPSVITNDAIAVAQTVETLRGTITAGSELISAQGFEWRELGETIWTPLTVTLIDNAMIHNLNGLTANTEYEFRAYATTASAITYGTAQTFRTLAMPPPEVRTGLPTSIAQTSAILTGTVYETMAPIISLGFEWRLLGENTWTQIPTSLIDHIITYNLTGLTAYTDYEYRAYATTSEGSVYGVTQSFQTLPIAPTVVTNPATSITQTIATLNGTIASGSETITTKGFEWRKLGVGTWTTITLTGEEIIYNLTGIIANTSYEYRAYAITASGTVYGQTQNFTTLPIVPPTVVTDLATNVEQTLATLNGTITMGSEIIISQGFEYKLASASAWTSIPISGAMVHNLTGLTPNRAYEFRAYVVTESGTTYGMIMTFTTPAIPQIVETSFATAISETVATINANITSGSELII